MMMSHSVGPDPSAAGEGNLLRILAERLLGYRSPMTPEAAEVQLLVGELPRDLPLEIPLAEGSHMIGSLVIPKEHITIVLDATQPPDQVMAFYSEQLTVAGWRAQEFPPFPPGFIVPHSITFCKGKKDPALTISAHRLKSSMTDVRINIVTNLGHSPCRQFRPGAAPFSASPIPRLAPPPDVRPSRLGDVGASAGGDHAFSSVMLETEMDVGALATHYAAQFEGAGWARQSEGQGGPAAWSTWVFMDEDDVEWRGLFLALALEGTPPRRLLLVRVEMVA